MLISCSTECLIITKDVEGLALRDSLLPLKGNRLWENRLCHSGS